MMYILNCRQVYSGLLAFNMKLITECMHSAPAKNGNIFVLDFWYTRIKLIYNNGITADNDKKFSHSLNAVEFVIVYKQILIYIAVTRY